MKIAIISDIHGNLEALEKVAEDIKKLGITKVFCLGDVVGYGPHPAECLARVREITDIILKGNHEQAVIGTLEEAEKAMRDLAFEAIKFTRAKLQESEVAFLKTLPLSQTFSDFGIMIAHGSAVPGQEWEYVNNHELVTAELENCLMRVCVLGHTHIPLVFGSNHGLYKNLPDSLILDSEQKYLINVGSVGQPRDDDCRASYGIIDVEEGRMSFSLQRIFYDIQKTENAMRAANLNPILYDRLYCGE
jgi:predicted phosphodiesterase